MRSSAGRKAPGDVCEELLRIDVLTTDRQRPLVSACDQEQIFREPDEPLRLLRRGSERILELLARARPP